MEYQNGYHWRRMLEGIQGKSIALAEDKYKGLKVIANDALTSEYGIANVGNDLYAGH